MNEPSVYEDRQILLRAKYIALGGDFKPFLESGLCPGLGVGEWKVALNVPAGDGAQFKPIEPVRGDEDTWLIVFGTFSNRQADRLGPRITVLQVVSMWLVEDRAMSICELLGRAKEFDGKSVKVRGEWIGTPSGDLIRAYRCSVDFEWNGKKWPPAVVVSPSTTSGKRDEWEAKVWASDDSQVRLLYTVEGVFELSEPDGGFGEKSMFGAKVTGQLHHRGIIPAGRNPF